MSSMCGVFTHLLHQSEQEAIQMILSQSLITFAQEDKKPQYTLQ